MSIEQNTNEWLKWRNEGLGSSDAPIIMGKSKYMTPFQLWELKCGFREQSNETNFVQQLGHDFEPKMRDYIALSEDIEDFEPSVREHSDFPFLRSSLDADSDQKKVFAEIKYVGKDRFEWVKENQQVLEDHFDQVQEQFLVTGYEEAYYGVYTLTADRKQIDQKVYIKVTPDKAYIEETLAPALFEFWDCVKNQDPPPLTDRDVVEIQEPEAQDLAGRYAVLKSQLSDIEGELKEVEGKLKKTFKDSKFGKATIGKLTISSVTRKGTVDYKKVPELKGVDLDQYRKKASVSIQIRMAK